MTFFFDIVLILVVALVVLFRVIVSCPLLLFLTLLTPCRKPGIKAWTSLLEPLLFPGALPPMTNSIANVSPSLAVVDERPQRPCFGSRRPIRFLCIPWEPLIFCESEDGMDIFVSAD